MFFVASCRSEVRRPDSAYAPNSRSTAAREIVVGRVLVLTDSPEVAFAGSNVLEVHSAQGGLVTVVRATMLRSQTGTMITIATLRAHARCAYEAL